MQGQQQGGPDSKPLMRLEQPFSRPFSLQNVRPPVPLQLQGPAQSQPSKDQHPSGSTDDTSSDEDGESRQVPEVKGQTSEGGQNRGAVFSGRKRGGDRSEEKEHKRLKRLLRNRVSAQQARERKKAYLFDLEAKARELEAKNLELEERVQTLQRENFMLRQVVKNTTLKGNGTT